MQDQEYRRTEGVGLSPRFVPCTGRWASSHVLTTPNAFTEPKRQVCPKSSRRQPAQRQKIDNVSCTTRSSKQLDAEIESQQRTLDSMGDVTQLMPMRLQKHLDSYTKMLEMQSNAMKKISQTMDDIAENMK
jgi:hypothetical protein